MAPSIVSRSMGILCMGVRRRGPTYGIRSRSTPKVIKGMGYGGLGIVRRSVMGYGVRENGTSHGDAAHGVRCAWWTEYGDAARGVRLTGGAHDAG